MKNNSSMQALPQNRGAVHLSGAVKREYAEQYILLVLVGFATTIIVTRSFLELTGYPQIAGGDFHIAHVLWGGLLLFVAALLLLIRRGSNVYWLSSLLTGIGFGLFIDEVGKFITRTNDYFYPLAFPIIYAFFLLTLLVYARVRVVRGGDRAEIHTLLDSLERGVDPLLSPEEYHQNQLRLRQMADASTDPNVARLATQMLDFLQAENVHRPPGSSGWIASWQARFAAAEARWLTSRNLKVILVVGCILMGLRGALTAIATVLLANSLADPAVWQQLAIAPGLEGNPIGGTRLVLIMIALTLESVIGGLLFIAAILLIARQLRKGLFLSYWTLLFSLTAVQLLSFYFNQFDIILTTLLQFGLLFGVLRYRTHFLEPESAQ